MIGSNGRWDLFDRMKRGFTRLIKGVLTVGSRFD